MTEPLKLLRILAYPDDESMGSGPLLAKYSAEGVQTYLICATRGEYGWTRDKDQYPGQTELGKIRQAELLASPAMAPEGCGSRMATPPAWAGSI